MNKTVLIMMFIIGMISFFACVFLCVIEPLPFNFIMAGMCLVATVYFGVQIKKA